MEKQKYVRLKQFNTIIIFDIVLNHSDFKRMNPVSAGFCYIGDNMVKCFGESVSLNLESDPEDSKYATKQLFGFDAMLELN